LNEKSVGEEFRLITEVEWKDACREGGKKFALVMVKMKFSTCQSKLGDAIRQIG